MSANEIDRTYVIRTVVSVLGLLLGIGGSLAVLLMQELPYYLFFFAILVPMVTEPVGRWLAYRLSDVDPRVRSPTDAGLSTR